MLLIISGLLLGVTSVAIIYNHASLKVQWGKYKSVVKSYRDQNISTFQSYTKAAWLIGKCYCVDWYHLLTSIRSSRYLFVKYVNGGNISITILPVRNGPKSSLEYAYIDDERMDELVTILAGQSRDFSGQPQALLEFGDIIRYKFEGQDEVILQKSSESDNLKKQENIKKLKKLVWMS